MALYEQYDAEGVKTARAFTVDGSDRDAELRALVGTQGWRDAADESPRLPNRTASKADWKAHAIAAGVDEADAEKATRDELAELFHGPKV